jgi:alanyl-tRNA synthetase
MWSYNQVKNTFIEYFKNKYHMYIPESSLIPKNDNSLLFTNSGMVQFKNIFLGLEEPKHYRVCNSQKCIRAGGKHNDLDDVGKDSYHHTLFMMLGNWAFNYDMNNNNTNSYFKKEAIDMAWDLLTNVYKLDKNNIYVTYFGGNSNLKLDPDHETKNIWLKYLPGDRILPFGMKENFWEMGLAGPCGPCTEIHYDKMGNRDASTLVNKDDPTVIEIWNLVFMQFKRHDDGNITQLTMKHVDTGAGLERLAAILQNCTNYQIDLFKNIINIIKKITNGPEYEDKYGMEDQHYINMAYRVIADHVRTLIMAINDGVIPGPNSKNYVVRRIIRRAIRYGTKLNAPDGFLTQVTKAVIDLLSIEYPELKDNTEKISTTVINEEIGFNNTMKKGLRKFNKLLNNKEMNTKNLFELYSSFGFPIDIIKQLCEENDIQFNLNEYNDLLEEHIKKSKEGKQFTQSSKK